MDFAMSKNTRSRIDAFKRGEYPYGQAKPGAPEPDARPRIHETREDARFREAQERKTRERTQKAAEYELLDEGAPLLLRVYGPPSGTPQVVEAVREAKAMAGRRMSPRVALRTAAQICGVSLAELVACLRGMRGAE